MLAALLQKKKFKGLAHVVSQSCHWYKSYINETRRPDQQKF